MVAIAQSRLPVGLVIVGDAMRLPVADGAFDRVLAGHFYGHLPPDERAEFLSEARRVADELVVVDTAPRPDAAPEQWEERILTDGPRHRAYKRYLSGDELATELGGEPLFGGQWFSAARVCWHV
jgi:demethylmenaquinone methyltransferase/2-methoxy-6-polyprenyl-1,4-benzoquinol methylase